MARIWVSWQPGCNGHLIKGEVWHQHFQMLLAPISSPWNSQSSVALSPTRVTGQPEGFAAVSHRPFKKRIHRASLVAQWLRIRLPMQGTRVRALVQEDPIRGRATKPVCHNCWACALEAASHNYWAHVPQLLSPHATTTEARAPRARAPQQEKPPQWEARTPQQRVDPASCN